MTSLRTPYYLIDENLLRSNLEKISRIREKSGAKSVLALKCFSTWCVFDLISEYLDGTTSSSLFEVRLGREKFGKEVHAYSVAYADHEIEAVGTLADKIIFNSVSQLERFRDRLHGKSLGLRANPGISYSHYDLADPARRYSRLGVVSLEELQAAAASITGLMFHFNCENDDAENVVAALREIGNRYGRLLERMNWVSLGGGIAFTKEGFPVDLFCDELKRFADRFGVQLYLEPGEAAITDCCELVTTVLDIVHNECETAIVDASLEAHLLDHLIYRTSPRIASPRPGDVPAMIAGRSCLAGDVFGSFRLEKALAVGDEVRVADTAGYTMVKKNWFNGLPMPSIAVRRLTGAVELVRQFSYEEFCSSLS
jgi:carboxynorspermidine decarboxylase